MVAVDAAQHGRPGLVEDQVAAGPLGDLLTFAVHNLGRDARERPVCRPRLECGDSRQGADHDHAGLRLPPGVDDGHAVAADVLAIPQPGLGVDRLADRAEQPDRREVVLVGELVAPLHEGADRGRGAVEDVDLVPLDHVPPAVFGRGIGRALIHHAGGAVAERPVDDVAVPGDPANIGGAPIDVALLVVKDVFVGAGDAGQVAARGVDDALGLGCRTRCVEDVEQVLGVHLLRLAVRLLAGDDVVPPDVAALLHGGFLAGAPDHQHLLQRRALQHRFVAGRLQCRRRAAAVAAVRRDQHLGLGILDAAAQRLGREATEDHVMGGADAVQASIAIGSSGIIGM